VVTKPIRAFTDWQRERWLWRQGHEMLRITRSPETACPKTLVGEAGDLNIRNR
jgi:hypothetical protein